MRSVVAVEVVTGADVIAAAKSGAPRIPPRGKARDCALAVFDQVTPPSRL